MSVPFMEQLLITDRQGLGKGPYISHLSITPPLVWGVFKESCWGHVCWGAQVLCGVDDKGFQMPDAWRESCQMRLASDGLKGSQKRFPFFG